MGRWSRRVAPLFLRWVAAPVGQRWLDVGCGTGALSGAVLAAAAPVAVTGLDSSPAFVTAAAERVADPRAGSGSVTRRSCRWPTARSTSR
jgi:ubiquinone/menaquinone biosynthesis C-methylase UbiE